MREDPGVPAHSKERRVHADGSPGERSLVVARLTKNSEFRRVAKGLRSHRPAFILQGNRRVGAEAEGPRVGLTVTRKTGTAVERNRMRRRFKEALRVAPGLCPAPDCDYVLVIRREALSISFAQLVGDMTQAFREMAVRKGKPTRA
ncbi:MAG TPA: ribonuclease P protein component [Beijerinckiaceae bacterium]|nr:ribonuclease P protein component [Beijerinckiaceae bacterium]